MKVEYMLRLTSLSRGSACRVQEAGVPSDMAGTGSIKAFRGIARARAGHPKSIAFRPPPPLGNHGGDDPGGTVTSDRPPDEVETEDVSEIPGGGFAWGFLKQQGRRQP